MPGTNVIANVSDWHDGQHPPSTRTIRLPLWTWYDAGSTTSPSATMLWTIAISESSTISHSGSHEQPGLPQTKFSHSPPTRRGWGGQTQTSHGDDGQGRTVTGQFPTRPPVRLRSVAQAKSIDRTARSESRSSQSSQQPLSMRHGTHVAQSTHVGSEAIAPQFRRV